MNEPLDPPSPPPPAPPSDPPPGGSGSGFSPPPSGGGIPQPPGNPWEQREQLGFVNALVENVKLFVMNPTEAFNRTRHKGDFVGPLIYAIVVGLVGVIFAQIWSLLFNASIMTMIPSGEFGEGMAPMMATTGLSTLFAIVFYPIYGTIILLIISGIFHLCLLLVGGTAQSDADFEGTFRVACYSQVATLANIVPIVGGLIALVWGIILWVIGLSTLHRTTQGKALLAVLIPVILCCICAIVAGVLMGGAIMGALSNMS